MSGAGKKNKTRRGKKLFEGVSLPKQQEGTAYQGGGIQKNGYVSNDAIGWGKRKKLISSKQSSTTRGGHEKRRTVTRPFDSAEAA